VGFRYGAELVLVLLEDAEVLSADGMLEDLGCCEDVPVVGERLAPEGEGVGRGTGDAEA